MRMRLEGKTALVTGAGKGIGRAIALAFAKEGADIGVNALHKETSEDTAEAVRQLGRKAVAVPADVSSTSDVDAMVDTVLDRFGKIDILVNCAGGGVPGGQRRSLIFEFPPEEWDRVVAINLRSTYLCSRRIGQLMVKQNGGKILNMASVNAYAGAPFRSAYAPAKAGIVNLTMVMAVELGKYNINVNCLAPGVVPTDRILHVAKMGGFDMERVISLTPLGRLCEPDDVAKAAVFLVSDEANNITGVTLPVDAGWLAYRALV